MPDTTSEKNCDNRSEYYKLIAENSIDLILIISVQANPQILFHSPSFIKVLGYNLDVIQARFFHHVVHPDDKSKILEGLNNIIIKSKFFSNEALVPPKNITIRLKDSLGKWKHFDIMANRINDKILIVGHDISDKVEIEENLIDSKKIINSERALAEKYLDIAGVIIVAIGTDQKVTMINKKGCDILGYEQKEIIGRNWFDDFIATEKKAEIKSFFNEMIKHKEKLVEYFENSILTKSGEERLIAWHNTIIEDRDGKVIGTLSSGEDITEKRRNEDEIRLRNHELERFNKLSVGRELKMIELKEKIKELENYINTHKYEEGDQKKV